MGGDPVPAAPSLKRILQHVLDRDDAAAPRRGCGALYAVVMDGEVEYAKRHHLPTVVNQVIARLLAEKPRGDICTFMARAITDYQVRGTKAFSALEMLHREVESESWLRQPSPLPPSSVVKQAQKYLQRIQGLLDQEPRLCDCGMYQNTVAQLELVVTAFTLLRDVRSSAIQFQSKTWSEVDYTALLEEVAPMRKTILQLNATHAARSWVVQECDDTISRMEEAGVITPHLLTSDDFWGLLKSHTGNQAFLSSEARGSLPLSAFIDAYATRGREEIVRSIRASIQEAEVQSKLAETRAKEEEEQQRKKAEEEALAASRRRPKKPR